MQKSHKLFLIFSLVLLIATLIFGLLATWAFLFPETYNQFLPFYQLRPFHVSAAVFWIISAAGGGIMVYTSEIYGTKSSGKIAQRLFIYTWIYTICAIFISYSLKKFGGREYWEFPPVLCLPVLASWLFFMASYFPDILKAKGRQPLYVWMWSTGIFFFLLTFIEQNLWHAPWFRQSYLREVTVQWKANGAMVGAWNQMIYGTSLYLMVKISGNEQIARNKSTFFFYMLGLTNLMFNWGHHIYNLPVAPWIRNTSYMVSMTEWIFLIRIIRDFRKTLEVRQKLRHLITYRFLIASEFWVFMNLLLALGMSIPAINRYTHGTHITVAHAMGTTIGINTMILLASLSYMLQIDEKNEMIRKVVSVNYWVSQYALMFFWLALIAAGIIKGYFEEKTKTESYTEIINHVLPAIRSVSIAGIGLVISLGSIACVYIYQLVLVKPKAE